jgi:hypothetical protein
MELGGKPKNIAILDPERIGGREEKERERG